ncbi:MAG: TetR/AcrR family transcriptional regulator [Spongiibacteraceae bacterium]
MEMFSQQHSFNDTQQRIVDATIRCVKRWGVEKTSLNDIAKEAGVTRPTVYSYFPSRKDVIATALMHSGFQFAERLGKVINKYTKPADRLVEAMIYGVETLPDEPYLALITHNELSGFVNEGALTDNNSQTIRLALFREILKDSPRDEQDLIEVTEISTRLLLSLLMIPSNIDRDRKQLRAFLQRRLLPSVGLA